MWELMPAGGGESIITVNNQSRIRERSNFQIEFRKNTLISSNESYLQCSVCSDSVRAVGAVDMIKQMFPPFPVVAFSPNFTGFDFDGIDWYEIHRIMAQSPNATVMWVSGHSCGELRSRISSAQMLFYLSDSHLYNIST